MSWKVLLVLLWLVLPLPEPDSRSLPPAWLEEFAVAFEVETAAVWGQPTDAQGDPDYEADCVVLWRYLDRREFWHSLGLPPLSWGTQFSNYSGDWCLSQRELNAAFRLWAEGQSELWPPAGVDGRWTTDAGRHFHELALEARRRDVPYEALSMYLYRRRMGQHYEARKALVELRRVLGEDGFWSGTLPPCVPLECFGRVGR